MRPATASRLARLAAVLLVVGLVLTACVSLVNPSVIGIGGSMARAGEHLIAGVREVVYTRSMPLATAATRLRLRAATTC